jgi:hypothetical protein
VINIQGRISGRHNEERASDRTTGNGNDIIGVQGRQIAPTPSACGDAVGFCPVCAPSSAFEAGPLNVYCSSCTSASEWIGTIQLARHRRQPYTKQKRAMKRFNSEAATSRKARLLTLADRKVGNAHLTGSGAFVQTWGVLGGRGPRR